MSTEKLTKAIKNGKNGRVTVAILTRDISAELQADIAKFDRMLEAYLEGRLDEDVFRVFRLNNGIYGQRQGGRQPDGADQGPLRVASAPSSWRRWRISRTPTAEAGGT